MHSSSEGGEGRCNQTPRPPFESINSLFCISTRNDSGSAPPKTRSNEVIVFSRKIGYCPLQTLGDPRKVVTGLETLADSHFPRNYVSADVRVGKSTVADQPSQTDTVPSRPNEVWHMDTIGPTKTTSVHGFRYNTSFTCGYSGYVVLWPCFTISGCRHSGALIRRYCSLSGTAWRTSCLPM